MLLVPRRAGGGVGGRRWRTTRRPTDGSRLGDTGGERSLALGASSASVCHGCDEAMGRGSRKENSGAPLPGAPYVGSWVPAKPLRFELWGAREDLSLTSYALTRFAISASSRNLQHKGHKIYTGLGHRCGVIPYSSVWCGGLPLGLMMNSTEEEQPRKERCSCGGVDKHNLVLLYCGGYPYL